MFRAISNVTRPPDISFTFDGKPVAAQAGMTVAAALLANGITSFRKMPSSGTPRGPFCMMGACYDCLISIDGITIQACTVSVSEGLVVENASIEMGNSAT